MFNSRFVFLILVLASLLVACGSVNDQILHVNDIWARPALADGNSAVYFVIENGIAQADSLLSASSDVADAVEIHMTKMEDGNMQMMPQSEVTIPTGETKFEPGGLHVMLIGLKQDLKPGDSFAVTLDFASAGEMPLDVTVREP
ncbi:MAG: copper chaperone PCu(A)C [Anaerolineales bacterium]